MHQRLSFPFLATVTGFVIVVTAGIVWFRQSAVADPKLKAYGLQLVPPGAELVYSRGDRCGASNGWDRFYRPEDTCYEVSWIPEGDASREERLQQTLLRATELGWSADDSPEMGWILRRAGYDAVIRMARDETLIVCRAANPETRSCGDFVIVRAD